MSIGTQESVQTLLQAVTELSQASAATAMRWFGQTFDIDTKGDGSPVTIADRSAEEFAREWISARFPHDGVLGEEFPPLRPDAVRKWIIDPIDGTKAFVRGVPLWGTLVAVCEGETVLAGAACYPAVNEVVSGAPGEGCWWNGARAAVSTVDSLAQATVLVTDDRFPEHPQRGVKWRALAADSGVVRTWGDCYGYLLVATGRAEAMMDDIVNPWDAAALKPIIEEAGGVFTDWRGHHTAFGGDLMATNAALSATIRSRLLDSE
jgi:histidinol phosphatase-like enzyme (inositol monophosphatase family)